MEQRCCRSIGESVCGCVRKRGGMTYGCVRGLLNCSVGCGWQGQRGQSGRSGAKSSVTYVQPLANPTPSEIVNGTPSVRYHALKLNCITANTALPIKPIRKVKAESQTECGTKRREAFALRSGVARPACPK